MNIAIVTGASSGMGREFVRQLSDWVRAVKLVPHSIVMNIWLNQQKKAKNNKGLTSK